MNSILTWVHGEIQCEKRLKALKELQQHKLHIKCNSRHSFIYKRYLHGMDEWSLAYATNES